MTDPMRQNHLSYTKQNMLKAQARKTLLFFYIIPFLIINTILFFAVTSMPKFKVSVADTIDYKTVFVSITKESLYPLKQFEILLDTEPVELTKRKEGFKTIYETTLTRNGTLTLNAVNLNGMKQTVYEHIGSIDDAPPESILNEDQSDEDKVALIFEDSQSGIDFDKLYAIDAKGKHIRPILTDEEHSSAVFSYDTDSLEVHVMDKVGNQSIASFTKIEREGGLSADDADSLPEELPQENSR